METKADVVEQLAVVNIPTNDMAYTNLVYVHPDSCFLKAGEYVLIKGSAGFLLRADARVHINQIALSSLQRQSCSPHIYPYDTITVKSFDTKTIPVASTVLVVFESVVNFKLMVILPELSSFLAKEFVGHIVREGQWLASNKYQNRVLKFKINSVVDANGEPGLARISSDTIFTCECSPKSKDIVEIVPNPLEIAEETKKPMTQVPLRELEALFHAHYRVDEIVTRASAVREDEIRPYKRLLQIMGSRIDDIWEQEVASRKKFNPWK